jgi:hypothetical protein
MLILEVSIYDLPIHHRQFELRYTRILSSSRIRVEWVTIVFDLIIPFCNSSSLFGDVSRVHCALPKKDASSYIPLNESRAEKRANHPPRAQED